MITYDYMQRLKRLEGYAELWRDDKKYIELKAGLYATLFFKHVDPSIHSNEAIREALIACWQDYWQLVGPEHQKRCYRFSRGVHADKYPSAKVPPIDVFLRDPENFDVYQYYVYGGVNEDDASEYCFNLGAFPIYGLPEHPEALGYLKLHAPLSFVTNGRLAEFVALIKRCAARLQVDQGHGGLGFLRTYNAESTTRAAEYQLSTVFSGVDIDVPALQLGDIFWSTKGGHIGINSPHWLNFLHDRWVQKLGGVEAIRAQLPADHFVVEPYEGGLFIQAGAYPEPGHRDDGLPPNYVLLNQVLKPIRAPEMGYCYGDTPGELARYQGAYEYFTRFDQPEPPKPDPLEENPVYAMSGEPCPRSGLWSPRSGDVPLPDGYVKKGNRMPMAEWHDSGGQLQRKVVKWRLVKAMD
ncbi:type VI immunity family protein [Roseateles koreensis]|uniref:DUF3396 domain-containing protein n=1 Tax=Roseateles koreensis TaxID=2987526 RepID=A0ABT5KM97_9BURK|nr:type VI immunity family protein [Roseateles koreensis]MDC8784034.1 DUF3396 domain-containing protein [Roseateles koreensis]